MKDNDVFKVLVTTGDQDLLAKDLTLDDLALGQIGFFDKDSNISIDETSTPPKGFYLAVAVDKDGDGVKDDIEVSAGQFIPTKNVKQLSFRAHTGRRPQIVDIETFTDVPCDKDFTIRVEYINQEILRRIGFNQFSEAFSVRTGVANCTDGVADDVNEVQKLLIAAIEAANSPLIDVDAFTHQGNVTFTGAGPTADGDLTITIGTTEITVAALNADTAAQTAVKAGAAINADGTYTAYVSGAIVYISGTTDDTVVFDAGATGATATDADMAKTVVSNVTTFETQFPDVPIGVRITTVPLTKSNISDVNLRYYHPRETNIIVSLVEGFDYTETTVTTVQKSVNEEGNGYDIKQKEYHSQLNAAGPYILSESTGTPKNNKFYADVDEEYDQFIIEYDFASKSGFGDYNNEVSTIVAIPETSSVTGAAFVAALDALLTGLGFNTLASDYTAADEDPAVIEATEDRGVADDGLA